MRKHFKELRMCLRKKNDKKITFLCKKYDMRDVTIEELDKEDRIKYEGS